VNPKFYNEFKLEYVAIKVTKFSCWISICMIYTLTKKEYPYVRLPTDNEKVMKGQQCVVCTLGWKVKKCTFLFRFI
jgi:hypothetical protein